MSQTMFTGMANDELQLQRTLRTAQLLQWTALRTLRTNEQHKGRLLTLIKRSSIVTRTSQVTVSRDILDAIS